MAMTTRRTALATMLAAPLALRAQPAVPAEIAAELPGARLTGRGRLRFFGLHVYDARLWAGPGFEAERFAQHPLGLELEYARTLDGSKIAERSLDEMKRSGPIPPDLAQRWLEQMTRTFPDVAQGDRITGVQRPAESARFFVNGALRGELRDPEFATRFFGIWLGPQTSEPALRRALLGLDPARS